MFALVPFTGTLVNSANAPICGLVLRVVISCLGSCVDDTSTLFVQLYWQSRATNHNIHVHLWTRTCVVAYICVVNECMGVFANVPEHGTHVCISVLYMHFG